MNQEQRESTSGRIPQIIVVMLAAAIAVTVVISRRTPETDSGTDVSAEADTTDMPGAATEPAYDMLAYLDRRVGLQETRKDVRCWSSFNKLQMFITNCEISEDAKSERIEQHMRLIESLYQEACSRVPEQASISADAVSAELQARFPQTHTDEGTQFRFNGGRPTLVIAEALKDYSDTIEPWRLLQTWTSRRIDENGELRLDKQFNEDALLVLYDFFRAYDLALLQKAREHAMKRKQGHIDAEAVAAAFGSPAIKKH